jgi:hypothetical protein
MLTSESTPELTSGVFWKTWIQMPRCCWLVTHQVPAGISAIFLSKRAIISCPLAIAKAEAGGNIDDYIARLSQHHHTNACPFGCDAVESTEHLATCPHTDTPRQYANSAIEDLLRKEELPVELCAAGATWLFQSSKEPRERYVEQMSDKEYSLAYIPRSWAAGVRNAKPKKANAIIAQVQAIVIAALVESWKMRCGELFGHGSARNPIPAAQTPPAFTCDSADTFHFHFHFHSASTTYPIDFRFPQSA